MAVLLCTSVFVEGKTGNAHSLRVPVPNMCWQCREFTVLDGDALSSL